MSRVSEDAGLAELQREVWRAHVPVTSTQHDPAKGLLHGYCERCREPWPCKYSPEAACIPSLESAR